MITDFLIDQKAHIDRLTILIKGAKTKEKQIELLEQREYLYNQGLQAVRRHGDGLPKTIRDFYMGAPGGVEPDMNKIYTELEAVTRKQKIRALWIQIIGVLFIMIVIYYLLL